MLQVNFSPFPILITERLVLRRTELADAPSLFYLRSHDDVMRFIDRPRPSSLDDIYTLIRKIHKMIEENAGIEWAVTLKGADEYIGSVSFHLLMKEHYRAEIGYLLHPAFHRKGIMSEAVTAALTYGFGEMELNSVEAIVTPGNDPSVGLLEHKGFLREGHFRQNRYSNGKFLDTFVFSLRSADWQNRMR
ncbi:MAG: GNAT family N-acetyltransferase [Chitinophagaceae bacterium]|nr:GNAT family N-acetyltransferase [Chitinophagaceae bacterium]